MLDQNLRYHIIERWQTPASAYPRAELGEWSISTRSQEPGIYKMQTYGSFYYQPNPIQLTVLKEGDLVWFTDEPRQMYALADIGLFRAFGKVIVGGLGLGLIHHFLRSNPMVSQVITIERAEKLRELVWPYMAYGELVIGDFYDVLPEISDADTIITDFIFGYQGEETWAEIKTQRDFIGKYLPNAQFLEHGYQHRLDAEDVQKVVPDSALGLFDQVKIVR